MYLVGILTEILIDQFILPQKKNKINSQLEAAKNLIVIKDFGGFKFYKRELK
jgi:hypothetical protein